MRPSCTKCGRIDFWHCKEFNCPYQRRLRPLREKKQVFKQEFTGQTPNVFVGRYGYPKVNVGFLSTENYADQDAPKSWKRKGLGVGEIIARRSELINSKFQNEVKSFSSKFAEAAREVGLAKKPVDVEVKLSKIPYANLEFGREIMPFGPSVDVKKIRVTDNAKVETRVDRVLSDTDLKAGSALELLRKKGLDEHRLTKLLSTGNLGVRAQRKLVPTRWAITATDDQMGKAILSRLRDTNVLREYAGYVGSYMGNYYVIICLPSVWSYELFEGMADKQSGFASQTFSTDAESFHGRKTYAAATVGGYYAARLAILEYFEKQKRQAAVIAFRFVSDEYWAPLGVWVVREAVRTTLKQEPFIASSRAEILAWAKDAMLSFFPGDADALIKRSAVLSIQKEQKNLFEF